MPVAALRPSLEAVLMVADQPLDAVSLATAVGHPVEDVVAALQLLAEEYDVENNRMVGNFPQAFSHLTLVGAAVELAAAEAEPGTD